MRWATAWLLYWLGDAVSRLTNRADWLRLYPLHNRLMCWSDSIQGPSGHGPWNAEVDWGPARENGMDDHADELEAHLKRMRH